MRCEAPIAPQCQPTASDWQRSSAPARRRANRKLIPYTILTGTVWPDAVATTGYGPSVARRRHGFTSTNHVCQFLICVGRTVRTGVSRCGVVATVSKAVVAFTVVAAAVDLLQFFKGQFTHDFLHLN